MGDDSAARQLAADGGLEGGSASDPQVSLQVTAKAAVVERWSHTRARIERVPVPANVWALVERAAAHFGDRLAWSFFEIGEELSFQDVRTQSSKAANAFRARGIRKGSRVAIMVPNGPTYLTAFLGLARIGAVIVPVNGRYTAREVAHVLSMSETELFIYDPINAPIAEGLTREDIDLSDLTLLVSRDASGRSWADEMDAAPDREIAENVGWDDLMSIQFTSGTTGFPKGCMLTQRYWLNAGISWAEYVSVPVERFLCNQMLFYLDGQFITMACLYRGATLYCCSKPSSSKFLGWVRLYRINAVFYFDPLYTAPRTDQDADNELTIIHIFGFSPRKHAELEQRYGAIARESFGMTEFAPSLCMPLEADMMVGSASCGLPAPHTKVRIVDASGADVPRGDVGELWVRSPALMIGYCNDPEATAETLREGWLRTGDLFYQDEAGFFYIVGRLKDMVRRNAENVASVEVEAVLRLMPEIKEAAIVAVPDDVMGEEIKAYVQLMPGLTADVVPPALIVEFCAAQLAPFKVPRYIEYREALPMTESARVEKKKLTAGHEDLRVGSFDRSTGEWVTS